jgi:translation initiation factor IF-2
LLDSLRGSHIVEKEFGGITQHIGAFNVKLASRDEKNVVKERSITFLDTPGHAAFSMMRSRGAKITDIVVLVIAAEDGVMAQTEESIEHAKKSGCPIIVAINKIDKVNEERIERVKKELLKYELIPEEMGGDVQIVPISALKKINLDLLKEEIWAQSEIMDLKGDAKGLVEGYIIESTQDQHKGKLATVLIQRGNLKRGDYLVAGHSWCKVKSISDENSKTLNQAALSQAVQVMGWKELPHPGDEVIQVENEHKAKEIIEIRLKKDEIKKQRADAQEIKRKREEHTKIYREKLGEKRASGSHRPVTAVSINDVVKKMAEEKALADNQTESESVLQSEREKKKKLSIMIKADVNGSLEAILNVLETYNCHDKVHLDLVHFDIGSIKKSDLDMAEMFNSIIYCFNIPVNHTLEMVGESNNTNHNNHDHKKNYKIKHFNVIYKLFDDLRIELNELAPYTEEEEKLGEANVLRVFDYDESNKHTITVAGGRCVDGLLDHKAHFKLVRNEETIADGLLCKSLKHMKNDVATIKRNVEFGLAFDNQSVRPQQGDTIVCYSLKKVRQPIEWNLGF